jgi:hypothetical protein
LKKPRFKTYTVDSTDTTWTCCFTSTSLPPNEKNWTGAKNVIFKLEDMTKLAGYKFSLMTMKEKNRDNLLRE